LGGVHSIGEGVEIGADDHPHRDIKSEGRQERILSFADPDPPSVASDITETDYNSRDQKSPPPKGRYSVTVSDPEKRGEGIGQYVSYKITVKTEVSPGQYSSDSVLRRYRDFVWLQNVLTRKYKGYLIPSLPDKSVMGRFSNEFIAERKRALESFLNRIAVHTELRESVDVDMFLHATDEGVLSGDSKDLKQGEDGRLSIFLKDSSNWFSHAFTSREQQVKTDEDRKCDKVVEYAERLDNHLTAVHTQIDTLLKRSKGLAKCWFDFGLQCTLLGQFESKQDEAVMGTVFNKLGNIADLLSVIMTKKIEMENVHFREPVRDYLRMVLAVKEMIKTRNDVLQSYHDAVSDLEARQRKLAQIQGVPQKHDQAQRLERGVEEAQIIVDERLKELKRVTAICLAEAGRFRLEKEQALKNVVIDFVRMQIEHSKKVQKAWESILPDLQSV